MDKTNVPVYHERFKDSPWYGKKIVATVGGAGGIGSWLTFFLTRAGHSIVLYDFDTVDVSNLGGQLYGKKNVGQKKSDALISLMDALCGEYEINAMGKFGAAGDSSMVTDVCFMCFDNMDARKEMAEAWYNHQKSKKEKVPGEINILIDGRMEAETGMVFAIKSPADYERYMKNNMFDDAEVKTGPCSYRATTHNGAALAAKMIDTFNNHVSNKNKGMVIREVPYQESYEGPTKTYETIR